MRETNSCAVGGAEYGLSSSRGGFVLSWRAIARLTSGVDSSIASIFSERRRSTLRLTYDQGSTKRSPARPVSSFCATSKRWRGRVKLWRLGKVSNSPYVRSDMTDDVGRCVEPAMSTILRECFATARQGWKSSGFPIIVVGTTCDVDKIPTGVLGAFKEEISYEVSRSPLWAVSRAESTIAIGAWGTGTT